MDAAIYVKRLHALYAKVEAELLLEPPVALSTIEQYADQNNINVDPYIQSFWLKANGGPSYSPFFACNNCLTGYDFLSVENAFSYREAMAARAHQYEQYEEDKLRDKRIQPRWFHHGWLPFASFGGSTLLLISDFSPSAHGRFGQIIGYVHDPDEIIYVADSFQAFLTASIYSLEENHEELLAEL